MTEENFKKQIGRLRAEYGDKAYGEERVKVIWQWAKRLHAELFELTVSEALGNCAHAPLKAKLMETYTEVLNKNRGLKTHPECDYCYDGWIPDDQQPPTVYRCRCPNGQSLPSYVPEFKGILVRIKPTQAEIDWRKKEVQKLVDKTFIKMDIE